MEGWCRAVYPRPYVTLFTDCFSASGFTSVSKTLSDQLPGRLRRNSSVVYFTFNSGRELSLTGRLPSQGLLVAFQK